MPGAAVWLAVQQACQLPVGSGPFGERRVVVHSGPGQGVNEPRPCGIDLDQAQPLGWCEYLRVRGEPKAGIRLLCDA